MPVYLSKGVLEVVNIVEEQVGPILNANMHLADFHLARSARGSEPFVLISTEREDTDMPHCVKVDADFTLHDGSL